MTLSLSELERVVALSAPALRGARVRAVHDDGAQTLYLTVRVPGANLLLVTSAEPRGGRVALSSQDRPGAPQRPLTFTQLLRKHLTGAVVEDLCLPVEGDRVVALELCRRGPPLEDEAGEADEGDRSDRDEAPSHELSRWRLIAELTGRSPALLLVDASGCVRGSLHHPRDGRVGEGWTPPPPPSHPGARRVGQARFAALAGDDALALGDAIEAHYGEALARAEREAAVRGLRGALRGALKRSARRVEAVERDLERAEAAQQYRVFGDVLAANFTRLERGMARIELENFYDEMRPLEIALDPALAPRRNIERYYDRYKKYHSALPTIRARLTQAEERLLSLELIAEALEAGELEPEALREQLAALDVRAPSEATGGGGGGQRARREAQAAQQARPYRAFVSANGTAIWVGKNARQNDALTFGLGRGSDLWLHAAGWAGSHVLVRLERGQDVDSETLLDAATLAAHYSKARTGTIIEVHYTRQKHVRRARGAPAGQVHLAGGKTLAVRLEAGRLARLMASSPS